MFELQVAVTGMHLCPEFGNTIRAIENDQFPVNVKVEMLLSSDTETGVAKSMGVGIMGFADAFDRLAPELVICLGDRFEILAAAQVAMVMRIPMAHLFGGDTTEGAFDEMIRHSLTKMSHIHFVSNSESYNRVCQMGENPENVYNVGSPGLDVIQMMDYMDEEQLEENLNISFGKINLLITFHPSTLENRTSKLQLSELFYALEELASELDDVAMFFTHSNADTEGRLIGGMIQDFVTKGKNRWSFVSLGQQRYLSMMRLATVVVGNSSSGLYEVPSMKVPTVNIGDRQKGRLRASSVIDCSSDKQEILNAIHSALKLDCSSVENPYGDGRSGSRIVNILEKYDSFDSLLKKKFY
jgi:UDP-hydrolysing UDP-N-acetyl-D-glucosamine 2-epimerase